MRHVPGTGSSPGIHISLGSDRRGDSPRPAITIKLASPACRQVLSYPGHGLRAFPSLGLGPRGGARGHNPRAVDQIGTRPPGRWGNACRSTTPAPQSKPVTQASRLVARVAPSVAFGLGRRIVAAGPAHLRLYSDRGRLCGPSLKNLPGLVRRHRARTAAVRECGSASIRSQPSSGEGGISNPRWTEPPIPVFATGPPRLEGLGVGAGARAYPLKQVEDQSVDGVGQWVLGGGASRLLRRLWCVLAEEP